MKGFKSIEIQLKYVSGKHAIKGISRISHPVAGLIVAIEIFPACWVVLGISLLSVRLKELLMIAPLGKKNSAASYFAAFGRRFYYEQNRKFTHTNTIRWSVQETQNVLLKLKDQRANLVQDLMIHQLGDF